MKKINKTSRWFFEKINNIDKPVASMTKKIRENSTCELGTKLSDTVLAWKSQGSGFNPQDCKIKNSIY